MDYRFRLGLGLAILFCLGVVGPARPAAAQKVPPEDLRAGNLLVNPGFEDGFYSYQGISELIVGQGWLPWYDEARTRPEYKDEPYARKRPDGGFESFSLRVFNGVNVQKYFTFSANHDAGLVQQVRVPAGAVVRFEIWVHTWSSDCDDPCVSPRAPCRIDSNNHHGTYRVQVGIHPGGALPERLGAAPPEGVRWSAEQVEEPYDDWVRLSVEAFAVGEVVSVYTRGRPDWGVKHNDSYWDNAYLAALGPDIPTASPTRPPASATPATPSATGTRPPGLTPGAYLPIAAKAAVLLPPTGTPWGPTPMPMTSTPGPASATPMATVSTQPPTLTRTPTPDATGPTPIASPTPGATEPPPPGSETPGTPPTPTIPATPTPEGTAPVEPSETPLPTPTAFPTPTVDPAAPCATPLVNGDFETGDLAGWSAGHTGPAAAMPAVSGEDTPPDGGGAYSLRVGLVDAELDGAASWAWAAQSVMIPGDVVTASLRFDVRAVTRQSGIGDWQMIALRDAAGTPLKLLYWQPGASSGDWERLTVDLDAGSMAGREVRVSIEVYNDGDGAPSALYVDNLRLEACRPGAVALSETRPVRSDPRLAPDLRHWRAWAPADADDPAPPGTDLRIEYPVRYFPGQENFWLPDTCSELDFESVLIHNAGAVPVKVDGWTLEDLDGNRYEMPPLTLAPADDLRVWVRGGRDLSDGRFTDLYWSNPVPIWDNEREQGAWDVARLRDDTGAVVAERGYP